jgi:hypothetical protein
VTNDNRERERNEESRNRGGERKRVERKKEKGEAKIFSVPLCHLSFIDALRRPNSSCKDSHDFSFVICHVFGSLSAVLPNCFRISWIMTSTAARAGVVSANNSTTSGVHYRRCLLFANSTRTASCSGVSTACDRAFRTCMIASDAVMPFVIQ